MAREGQDVEDKTRVWGFGPALPRKGASGWVAFPGDTCKRCSQVTNEVRDVPETAPLVRDSGAQAVCHLLKALRCYIPQGEWGCFEPEPLDQAQAAHALRDADNNLSTCETKSSKH